jgi:hypothetical protein
VTPIWYPVGRHDVLRPLLEWLATGDAAAAVPTVRAEFGVREETLLRLTRLTAPQLTLVEELAQFPARYRPGASASVTERAAALMNWAESPGGCGVAAVTAAMERSAKP